MEFHTQNYPIYLVTFKESPRREPAIRRLETSGLEYNVVDGVYGAGLDDEILKRITSPLTELLFPKTGKLKKGEIACYLSHILAHREIAASDATGAIIMEDDAVMDPLFFEFQGTSRIIPDAIDICFLSSNSDPASEYRTKKPRLYLTEQLSISLITTGLHLTTAYYVSRAYCLKRLSNVFPIYRAVDKCYSFLPFPIVFAKSNRDLVTIPDGADSIIDGVENRSLRAPFLNGILDYNSPVRRIIEPVYRKTVKYLLHNRFLSPEENLKVLNEIADYV